MWVYIWNKLPTEYQEVEWIWRNGNNYIDTWWIPKISTNFEVQIWYKISTSWQRYWIISNYNDTSWCLSVEVNNGSSVTNNKVRLFYRASSDYNLYSSNTMNASSFNDIKITSNWSWTLGIDLNWTSTTWTTSWSYANASAYLFIDRQLRWTTFSNNSFISYCKIYENWTLVRNFIPCYRKSDSVIGLYDLVNNQFYTNSWTGTFSKWSDVNNYYEKLMKNAYIGEYRVPWSNTYIYYPLTSDLKDVMWNWNTWTMHWTCTFSSTTGIYVTGESWNYVTWLSVGINNRSVFTLNVWIKPNAYAYFNNVRCLLWNDAGWYDWFSLKLEWRWPSQWFYPALASGSSQMFSNSSVTAWWSWKNVCITRDSSGNYKYYINWTVSQTWSGGVPNNYSELWLWYSNSYGTSRWATLNIKDYIVETVTRTSEQVAWYYNQTKSQYWIS